MSKRTCRSLLKINTCALSVMLAFAASAPAHAFQFKNEAWDVAGSLDTTISLGGAWRLQGRDPALVGISNGGTSRDINSDDGNLNFNKGNLFSALIKGTHEIDLSYRKNYGAFVRATYFYDKKADDAPLGPLAHNRTARGAKFLDAFLRGTFDLADRKLNVRLGNQVISWGESTFIPNGINIINPVDVTKLRTPGSELKEALTPTPIIWASQQLTNSATVEFFWNSHFTKTQLDPRGTFFSTTDVVSDDGDRLFAGSGRRVDQHHFPGLGRPPTGAFAGVFGLDPTAAVFTPRSFDRDPKDERQQLGVAFRYLAEALNRTEFGAYFVNYHSRTPLLSGTRGAATVSSAVALRGLDRGCATSNLVNFNVIAGANPLRQGICTGAIPATYFADFPANIRLYGLSFNSQVAGGVALQGEYSYRPNQPVQLAPFEVVLATVGLGNNITGGGVAAASVRPGTEITGFRRVEMHQVQLTASKLFGPTLGANQFFAVGEVGYTHLNLPSGLRFAGPGVALPAPGSSTAGSNGSTQPGAAGYGTKDSWGYRLLGRMDFNNAIGPATLSPRIAFSHDVHGVSPTFNQGTYAATVGLGYNYLEKWQADIAYTNFFGGRTYSGTDPVPTPGQSSSFATSANPLKDRDFLSVSISYSF